MILCIMPLYYLGQRAMFNIAGMVGEVEVVVIARADNGDDGFYYTMRLAKGGEIGAKECDVELVSYLVN